MRTLSFEITFPNVGSWNGKFTGAENLHFSFRKVSQKELERLMQGKEYRNFSYNFGDGWTANIKMMPMFGPVVSKIKRKNMGFMGYEWMINSIIENDKILNNN